MPRPDEGLIHTWLDGECTPEEAARVERLVATDPAWAAAVAEARGLVAASSRILSALDAVPGDVIPRDLSGAPRRAPRTAFRVRPWMAVAASLVLVVGTATVVRDRVPASPVLTEESLADSRPEADVPAPPPPTADVAAKAQPSDPIAELRREAAPSAASPRAAEPAPQVPPSPARARLALPQTRGATPERIADSPMALASVARLEGCWNVTAPEPLVGVLRGVEIVRTSGDTLVLAIPEHGELTVVRAGDILRGALTATRVDCPQLP